MTNKTWICLKNGGTYNFPNDLNIETKLSDILEKNIEDKYTLSNNLWGSLQRIKEKHLAKGNGFGYCLFDEDAKYVSTISARYYKDGAEILVKQNNKNPRRLTPREALNLQGYPDNFKIVCSDAQTYRQVGNSLSLNVIREIVKELEIQNILINYRQFVGIEIHDEYTKMSQNRIKEELGILIDIK